MQINASVDGSNYEGVDEIQAGGKTLLLTAQARTQEKTATTNGNVLPDSGYDGLSKVVVNVPSPSPNLQSKSVSISENGTQQIEADNGYDGLAEVDITVSVSSSAELPTLTDPATASDIVSGKEAIDGNGNKITGTGNFPTNFVELLGGRTSNNNSRVLAKFHGTSVPSNVFGSYGLFWLQGGLTLKLDDAVTGLAPSAFHYCCSNYGGFTLTSDNSFANLTSLGQECFRDSGLTGDYTFPNVDRLYGSANGQFTKCTKLTGIHMPKVTNVINMFNNCSGLLALEFGSIGYAVTAWQTGATVKAEGTMTAYTNSSNIDSIFSAMRAQNANCTIVIKASESLEYNGNSYAAGDTVITDTPS